MNNEEIFKPIPGYEDRYKINNTGKIISIRSNRELKSSIMHNGYLSVKLQKNNKRFRTGVHRLVALTFIPTDDTKKEVNHKDGNKLNNSVQNLEWVTSKENINHSILNGLRKTKVDRNTVVKLCEFLSSEEATNSTYDDILNKFNINIQCLQAIYKRRIWRGISNDYQFKKIKFKTKRKSDEDIREICEYIVHNSHLTNQEIANIFDCNRTYIADLKKMKYRKEITEEYFKH